MVTSVEPQGKLIASSLVGQPITVIVADHPAAVRLLSLVHDSIVTTFDVEINGTVKFDKLVGVIF